MCCDSGSAPPPPDLSKTAAASERAAELAYQTGREDLDFRKQVYADSQPRQNQLYDLASQVAQQQMGIAGSNEQRAQEQWKMYQGQYAPNERAMILDAYGGQYLGDEDIQQALAWMNPRYNTVTGSERRSTAYTDYEDEVTNTTTPGAPRAGLPGVTASFRGGAFGDRVTLADGRVMSQAEYDQLAGAGGTSATTTTTTKKKPVTRYRDEDVQTSRQELDAAYEQERTAGLYGLARKAENAAGTQAAARAAGEVNRAFGQQARQLGRMGAGDPNRMALMAAKLGQQQTLAGVGAANQAREGVRAQQLGLRSGVANFGRNMPNTAGQAFGLATQAGNSAVANQNQGFMSGLPYAQFQAGGYGTQLGAAGIGGQQALGMGGLMNQQYGQQLNAWNAQQQASGAGLAGLGQFAGMAMSAGSGQPWWLKGFGG